MTIEATLAHWSNVFVYVAMGVFAASFVAFAASLAAGRGRADTGSTSQATNSTTRSTRSVSALQLDAASADAGWTGNVATVSITEPGKGDDEDLLTIVTTPGRRAGNIGLALLWLATGLLTAGVLCRGISAGRAPWGNMYEFSVVSALSVSLIFLGISTRKDVRWLGVFIVGMVLLTLGVAVTLLYTESAQLVPALNSYWLITHVTAAIISAGAFTFGAAVTVLYLVRERAEKKAGDGAVTGWLSVRLPAAQRLDLLAYRVYVFVFPLWTFAVIAGAIWAQNSWGRYWGWDPKETWAFITWVVYAGYLHARATAGWRGRKAAIIALVGYGCFLFNYFGVNIFIAGLHSYAGVK